MKWRLSSKKRIAFSDLMKQYQPFLLKASFDVVLVLNTINECFGS